MDKDTSIQEVKEREKKFCDKREWGEYHDAKELAIGIITEASELLHMFRFKSKEEAEAMFKNEEKRQEINEEVADIFVFTLLLVERYNIDLDTVLADKLKKNEGKYPVSKAKGSSNGYKGL